MIQAPNLQYIPAQQTAQQSYMPQGANNAVPYVNQNPGVIYNYPMSNSYGTSPSSYMTQRPQYNGVNIEINGPQGQGLMPAQWVPTGVINTPQIYPTQQPLAQQPIEQQPAQPQVTQVEQPATQPVPAPQIQTPKQTQNPAAAPVVENPQAVDPNMTPASFAGRLKTDDLEAQKQTIEEIAEKVKFDDKMAPVLLDTQIFDALFEIVAKDNSSLAGPSPEVLALRDKPEAELTEEEKTKAKTASPLEAAERNKQYALYTISYLQEALNKELEKRGGKALALKDLPGIDKVVDTVKSNPIPSVRVAGIAALSHIARPEYKEDLKTVFELAKSDQDQNVKDAAERALTLLQ